MSSNIPQIKICRYCHREFPNTHEFFHKDRSYVDGLKAICKECARAYRHQHYADPKNKDYYHSQEARQRARIRDDLHIQRHPNRARARWKIAHEIAAGRLPSAKNMKCALCGGNAVHYHHHLGYEKQHWLDVIPVCQKCHSFLDRESN